MQEIPLQKKSEIPLLGLGTWQLSGEDCERAVQTALELGYRHIDTADVYQNHEAIGRAIKNFPREQLFLTSKILIRDMEPEDVAPYVDRFLDELQIGYLDLLLIHWPKLDGSHQDFLSEMMELKRLGKVQRIGVSNFVRFHFDELESFHFPIMNNQIEMHPYLQRKLLVAYAKKHQIPLTAYRPIAKQAIVEDSVLIQIGKKYGKTPVQIALRWLIGQDIVVIPKASQKAHLEENIEIFDFALDDEDFALIATLDRDERFCKPGNLPLYDD